MPSKQAGQKIRERGGNYGFRVYDVDGTRRYKGGFKTKGERDDALRDTLDGLNGGRVRDELNLQQLVDEYLAQHIAEDNTIATLTARLKHVTAAFGDTKLER